MTLIAKLVFHFIKICELFLQLLLHRNWFQFRIIIYLTDINLDKELYLYSRYTKWARHSATNVGDLYSTVMWLSCCGFQSHFEAYQSFRFIINKRWSLNFSPFENSLWWAVDFKKILEFIFYYLIR